MKNSTPNENPVKLSKTPCGPWTRRKPQFNPIETDETKKTRENLTQASRQRHQSVAKEAGLDDGALVLAHRVVGRVDPPVAGSGVETRQVLHGRRRRLLLQKNLISHAM